MDDPRFLNDVELATAAMVRDELEAEMIRGLLESAGVPSIIQAAGEAAGARYGLNGVPGFTGPMKVLVHEHRLDEARAVIAAVPGEELS